MIRVYRYRLYPTRAQEETLRWTLDRLRELYNAALQERRDAWRKRGMSVSAYEQTKALPEIKALRPEYCAIFAQVLQDVIKRLDKAYRAFFRRVKAGEKPGYPRFRGRSRYASFTYPQVQKCGVKLLCDGKRVRLAGIGEIKVRLHRPIEGCIKTATVTIACDGHWYICFVCDDVPTKPLPETGREVGIDVGLKSFLATSDSDVIENPRPLKQAEAKIRRAQRRISKRKRGSNRRRKAVALLARKHAHVANVRRDFHHKTATSLVRSYDVIVVEGLNVKGLARGMLAKSVHDVGWGSFLNILASKAECAGREVVKVNPAGTSQICSVCGATVHKDLSVRVHKCPHCEFTEDRDVNAALNILRAGRALRRGAAEALS